MNSYVCLLLPLLLVHVCYATPPPEPPGLRDDSSVSERPIAITPYSGRSTRTGGIKLKSKYVAAHGVIRSQDPGGARIRVDATMPVSDYAHQLAATTVMRMTRYMSVNTFNRVATYSKVGVFTRNETLVVYPEYAKYRNPPGCAGSCSGPCNRSCSADGRKYWTLAGTGGSRGVVVDDNVLCNRADPYTHRYNVLVHEYAHTILRLVTVGRRDKVNAAYQNARNQSLWRAEYAMTNEEEYWAEASGTFFYSDLLGYSTGGMNQCGYSTCTSEWAARTNMLGRDPLLYTLLADIYTDNRPGLPGSIGVCTSLQA